MTIREIVLEAKRTVVDFQQVYDGERRHTLEQRNQAARALAASYLSNGFHWLKKVDEATVAAVFVALGRSEFALTSKGQCFFNVVARELEEDAEDVPYGWSAVQEYLQFGPRLQPIVQQAVEAHAESLLVRVAFIASRLMKKEERDG